MTTALQTTYTDEQIKLALASGEEEKAFRLLLSAYNERLYWHVRKMLGVHEDADDVVQNTWIKVHRHIATFKGDAKLYTWLYRIATNEALTFLRKQKTRAGGDDAHAQIWSEQVAADPYFDGDEAALLLDKLVMTLPEKQKQVFIYRYYENLSYDDISSIMKSSVGALKAQYHHAKNKIETALRNV